MSSSTLIKNERCIVEKNSRQMTDEQLLLSYRSAGDQSHFTELERRYRQPLLCFLRRQIGSASVAEDVLQATLMQLHVKCGQFEEGRMVRPWLYRIAMNQAIDNKRRNRRHEIVSLNQSTRSTDGQSYELVEMIRGDNPLPVETLQVEEQHKSVRQAVASLPQSLQTIVSLVFFQGLKYREAAEELSIPVGTLKSRMHSALLQLRSEWPELQLSEAA